MKSVRFYYLSNIIYKPGPGMVFFMFCIPLKRGNLPYQLISESEQYSQVYIQFEEVYQVLCFLLLLEVQYAIHCLLIWKRCSPHATMSLKPLSLFEDYTCKFDLLPLRAHLFLQTHLIDVFDLMNKMPSK